MTLSDLPNIKKIDLRENFLTDESIKMLIQYAPAFHNRKLFDLSNNHNITFPHNDELWELEAVG